MHSYYLALILFASTTLVLLVNSSPASNISPLKKESIQEFLDRTSISRRVCEHQKGDPSGLLTCPGGWKLWKQERDPDFPRGTCMAYALSTMLINTCGSSPTPAKVSYALYGPDGEGDVDNMEKHLEFLGNQQPNCEGIDYEMDILQKREVIDPESDPDSMMRGMLPRHPGQPRSVKANGVGVTLRRPKGSGSGHVTVVVAQTSTTTTHITWSYIYETPNEAFHKLTDPTGGGRAVHVESV